LVSGAGLSGSLVLSLINSRGPLVSGAGLSGSLVLSLINSRTRPYRNPPHWFRGRVYQVDWC
ncbi:MULTISPECIES: hypothetical protein, partial [unclassified Limnospira]|uniref:hypothetical protein n=1 Tax=unclassified Limnospira TaxID=2642885 RepID=UPI0028E1029D